MAPPGCLYVGENGFLAMLGMTFVCHPERSEAKSKDPFFLGVAGSGVGGWVPAGGGTFLFRQESTQRMRLRGGFELIAPAIKATSPENPTRPAFTRALRKVSAG